MWIPLLTILCWKINKLQMHFTVAHYFHFVTSDMILRKHNSWMHHFLAASSEVYLMLVCPWMHRQGRVFKTVPANINLNQIKLKIMSKNGCRGCRKPIKNIKYMKCTLPSRQLLYNLKLSCKMLLNNKSFNKCHLHKKWKKDMHLKRSLLLIYWVIQALSVVELLRVEPALQKVWF